MLYKGSVVGFVSTTYDKMRQLTARVCARARAYIYFIFLCPVLSEGSAASCDRRESKCRMSSF